MTNQMKSILSKLLLIQTELKAPKNQINNFGKYKYRSCEDILEAVKPLLKLHGCVVVESDEIKNIGNFNYLYACATLYCISTAECIAVNGVAREAQTKKGMDDAQITGSASSYARKYALNGLFSIDDTKDSDSLGVAPKINNKTELTPLKKDKWNAAIKALNEGHTFRQVESKYIISLENLTKLKNEIQI
jgi:hypothetical protein